MNRIARAAQKARLPLIPPEVKRAGFSTTLFGCVALATSAISTDGAQNVRVVENCITPSEAP